MTDVRSERCASLASPVLELMGAVMRAQGGVPGALDDIVVHATAIQEVLQRGTDGIDHPGYLDWARIAPATIAGIVAAAEAKEPTKVWELFTDPDSGLHRAAGACAGEPGW